jgi:hypothetical protein
MRKHEDMLKAGRVSVWIGSVSSEDVLLSYVDDRSFSTDFDFEVNSKFGRELKCERVPVALEHLVEGFSAWRKFGDACARRGKEMGINSANCMVVFYAFEYVPTSQNKPGTPVTFLGSFDV